MTALEILKHHKLAELAIRYPNTSAFNYQANFSDKSEKTLEDCILYFAKVESFQAERIKVKANRIDNRTSYIDSVGFKKTIGSVTWAKSSMQAGSADMSCTIKGRSVKVEIKIGKDFQKLNQKQYQKQVELAGGIYWIIRSFQEFYDKYLDFIKN